MDVLDMLYPLESLTGNRIVLESHTQSFEVGFNVSSSRSPETNASGLEDDELDGQQKFVLGDPSTITLVSLYGVIFLVGLTGNILTIVAMVRNGRPAVPVRNHLLINLCVSDLLVTLVCVPLTVTSMCWTAWFLGEVVCKMGAYFQSVPVAASTLSLMMLSLDRYAAIRHPRCFSKLRQKNLSTRMIVIVWLVAAALSAPIFYVRSAASSRCVEVWPSTWLRLCYRVCYLFLVFVVPCLVVAVCHVSVGYKLCTANLVADEEKRPKLKPKQVIIVAQPDHVTEGRPVSRKVVPYGDVKGDSSEEDDDGFLRMQIRTDLELFNRAAAAMKSQDKHNTAASGTKRRSAKITAPVFSRATRREKSIIRAHRRLRRRQQQQAHSSKPALLQSYSNQSFRSRRRLANLLVVLVVVFVACWLPYIVCSLWEDIAPTAVIPHILLPFALFLGHAHSAVNPIVYWLLNRSIVHQVGRTMSLPGKGKLFRCHNCTCCFQLRITKVKVPQWRRNSSTNEAALGPFHPKYISRRKPNVEHPSRCTSQFLQ